MFSFLLFSVIISYHHYSRPLVLFFPLTTWSVNGELFHHLTFTIGSNYFQQVLVCFAVAVVKSNFDRKRLTPFYNYTPSLRDEKKFKHELKQSSWNNAAYWFALLAFFIQDHRLRSAATHSELGLLTSPVNQERDLQTCLKAIWWRQSSVKILFSQMSLACVSW